MRSRKSRDSGAGMTSPPTHQNRLPRISILDSAQPKSALAVAYVYGRLARTSDLMHQYVDMIAYERAAIAFGGTSGTEHFICYAYFKLKQYDDAVQTCTEAVQNAGNLTAHYWRGASYHETKQLEAALRDLRVIADSQHRFRATAAIEMSVIYSELKDVKGSLEILNRYTFLFDEKSQNKNDLAVSYNNRCYAYMELGELQKALDDCTASLKFGSLPDAYRKQQELVKRLKARESGL
jgi:tetratricopeptide (TPR) repeat protein